MYFKDLKKNTIFIFVNEDNGVVGPFFKNAWNSSFGRKLSEPDMGDCIGFEDNDKVFTCHCLFTSISQNMNTRRGSVELNYNIDFDEEIYIQTIVFINQDQDGVITIPTKDICVCDADKEKTVQIKDLDGGDHFREPNNNNIYILSQIGDELRAINIKSGHWKNASIISEVIKIGVDVKYTDSKPPQVLFEDLEVGEEFFALAIPQENEYKSMRITNKDEIRRYVVLGGNVIGRTYSIKEDTPVRRT